MEKPNCEKCRYRHLLIKYGAPSACGKDCDQYGTNLCEKMNPCLRIFFIRARMIWHIVSCCKFAKLKDELFEQCSLKEIIDD